MRTLLYLSLLLIILLKTANGFLVVRNQQKQQQQPHQQTQRQRQRQRQQQGIKATTRTINVEFQREIPSTSVSEAKNAWLEFVWKKGGGLPAIVVPTENNKRLLLPAFMEEKLVDDAMDDVEEEGEGQSNMSTIIQYRVSKWPIPDFVSNSHVGIVQFFTSTTDNTTIVMVWKAQFDVVERYKVWNFVTEALISQACDNMVAYLRPPLVYTRSTRLHCDGLSSSSSLRTTRRPPPQQQEEATIITKWLDFVFDDGGGLPIYKPVIMKSHKRRMYIPPFMKESIVSVANINEEKNDDDDDTKYQITYQLDVPAFIGCHDHIGYVQFKKLSDMGDSIEQENKDLASTIDMIWTVKIRPYHNMEGFAKGCVSSVVTTLARNFKSHIEEPDNMVSVRPPRGGGAGDNNTFFRVRKDSWLGGVLDAHLRDQRSTLEQTMSLFQPNTWGRSTDNEEDGEGETWTRIQY